MSALLAGTERRRPHPKFGPRPGYLSFTAFALLVLAGCAVQNAAIRPRPEDPDPGLVYIVPGIEGHAIWYFEVRRAFRDAGVRAEFRLFNWGRPLNNLANLTEYQGNLRKAEAAARELADWRRAHPSAPLHIVGYSAGGGLAPLVVARLPVGTEVDTLTLVQPALSPAFDLTDALTHVRGRMTVFHSPSDLLVLGWGTSLFGTVDREFCPSAGKVGFDLDKALNNKGLRAKVQQIRWAPDWFWAGHFGNHVSMLGYTWNRRIVAPALLGAVPPAEAPAPAKRDFEPDAAGGPRALDGRRTGPLQLTTPWQRRSCN